VVCSAEKTGFYGEAVFKGYSELPTRQTIGDILNRLGYRLKNTKNEAIEKNSSNRCDF